MSWDVAVRAVLTFDARALAKWPRQKLTAVALPKSLPKAKLEATTVAAALKLLEERASYARIETRKTTWTLWAVLSEDDYLDHTPTLLAAIARAGAATGEVLLYGFLTGPEGLAHRVTVGTQLAIAKLSPAEEKKLLATREAKAFETWVEKQVVAEEAAAAKKRRTPSKFFKGMDDVRAVIEEAMDAIQRADDKALAKIVAKGRFYRFYAKAFKTGASIKKVCTPASQAFDDPPGAASDMLEIVHALDRAAAETLCARLLDAADMPDELRRTSAKILQRTAHARRVVEQLAFHDRGVTGDTHAGWELRDWAAYLATAEEVSTELLGAHLRTALVAARKDAGAAQVAHYLAAALILEREAWEYVPELATSCFEHPDATVRATIAQLFALVPIPVPIRAPRLDVLAAHPEDSGHVLIFELCRRLRLDPSRAFDELAPLIAAKHHAANNAVASVLGPSQTWRKSEMTPAEQDAVFAAEPRWKPVRKGVW